MTTKLSGAAATDVGRVRQMNEDRYLVGDGIYAVADGVGGHQAGEVAAQAAVEALAEHFTERSPQGLVDAVHDANRAVWELAQENAERRGMGTTLTSVALVAHEGEDQLAIANVGDSRTYLFQRGDLLQVTEDHSLVEELVREGQLTPAEAQVHPQRSIITRALGMEPEIQVDIWTITPYAGDRLLLCSDGLTNEVSVDKIAATLRQLSDPQEAARDLVRQARAHGGNDNITVVVIDVLDDGGRAEAASDVLGHEGTTTETATPNPWTSPRLPGTGTGANGGDGATTGAGTAGTGTATSTRTRVPTATKGSPVTPIVRPRRFTWRVALFAIAFLGILGIVAASLSWYARSVYYVGLLDDREVAIFQGHPGGFLWFEPKLAEHTGLTVDQLTAAQNEAVRAAKDEERTRSEAKTYVRNLRDQVTTTTPSTTMPTTTTTLPPTTTTVRPAPPPA